jgi:hypothetical protein
MRIITLETIRIGGMKSGEIVRRANKPGKFPLKAGMSRQSRGPCRYHKRVLGQSQGTIRKEDLEKVLKNCVSDERRNKAEWCANARNERRPRFREETRDRKTRDEQEIKPESGNPSLIPVGPS